MRIALYGGSFDPIHRGHVLPVLEASDQLGLDRVVYLPTARPPHKPGRQFAASPARLTMVELALLDYPSLLVSPLELTPGRIAYAVDSVRHFRARHPDDELYLLIGADSLAGFTTWREWEAILDEVRLAVLTRPGWDRERASEGLGGRLGALAAGGAIDFVGNEPVEASSTRLREILAAGETPPTGWMSELVLQYVRKYSLYR